MRPMLLRPPVLFCGRRSDFSGFFLVISSNVDTLMARRPGDVGLYFFTGILRLLQSDVLEEIEYLVAGHEGDDSLLPARAVAPETGLLAAALAVHVERIHRLDFHLPAGFNRLLDLQLVGIPRY